MSQEQYFPVAPEGSPEHCMDSSADIIIYPNDIHLQQQIYGVAILKIRTTLDAPVKTFAVDSAKMQNYEDVVQLSLQLNNDPSLGFTPFRISAIIGPMVCELRRDYWPASTLLPPLCVTMYEREYTFAVELRVDSVFVDVMYVRTLPSGHEIKDLLVNGHDTELRLRSAGYRPAEYSITHAWKSARKSPRELTIPHYPFGTEEFWRCLDEEYSSTHMEDRCHLRQVDGYLVTQACLKSFAAKKGIHGML